MNKVIIKKSCCALDLGDGSERGLYVNQDYILHKLHSVHRGISLMYTYYPNDKEWPVRASKIKTDKVAKGAWDYPYEDYFPYRGGREGLLDNEPFNFFDFGTVRMEDPWVLWTAFTEFIELPAGTSTHVDWKQPGCLNNDCEHGVNASGCPLCLYERGF